MLFKISRKKKKNVLFVAKYSSEPKQLGFMPVKKVSKFSELKISVKFSILYAEKGL